MGQGIDCTGARTIGGGIVGIFPIVFLDGLYSCRR